MRRDVPRVFRGRKSEKPEAKRHKRLARQLSFRALASESSEELAAEDVLESLGIDQNVLALGSRRIRAA